MSDRELLVYVDLAGAAHFVGRLWARRARNRESATFEYDADWLANSHPLNRECIRFDNTHLISRRQAAMRRSVTEPTRTINANMAA